MFVKNKTQIAFAFLVINLLALVGCNNANHTINTRPTTVENIDVTKVVDTINNKFIRKELVYDSTKTYIYLTFDDGPQGGTKECLELCLKMGIKATFFMVGRHANDKWGKQLVKNIKNHYPQILLANHSYTHAQERYQYFYQHPSMAVEDFYKAQDSLQVPYKIIRLPGNNAWVRSNENKSSSLVNTVCTKLDSAGYNVIGWDVEWNFTRGQSYPVQSPQKVANEVYYASQNHSHVAKHVMILTHERMFRTPAYLDSLVKFINIIKQNPNFVFETVDNYPDLQF